MKNRHELGFNYSYYARIESSKILPSSNVISAIATVLSSGSANYLVLTYCKNLFPSKADLFQYSEQQGPDPIEYNRRNQTPALTLKKQKFLTPLQVAAVTKSKMHYYLFLILTLARKPVEPSHLEKILGPEFLQIADDLKQVKLAFIDKTLIYSNAKELRFPSPDTEKMKKIYNSLDQWDTELGDTFNFKELFRRVIIRRVSLRYLGLIANHCELLVGLTKSSEETNEVHNSEVLSFSLNITRGKMPG